MRKGFKKLCPFFYALLLIIAVISDIKYLSVNDLPYDEFDSQQYVKSSYYIKNKVKEVVYIFYSKEPSQDIGFIITLILVLVPSLYSNSKKRVYGIRAIDFVGNEFKIIDYLGFVIMMMVIAKWLSFKLSLLTIELIACVYASNFVIKMIRLALYSNTNKEYLRELYYEDIESIINNTDKKIVLLESFKHCDLDEISELSECLVRSLWKHNINNFSVIAEISDQVIDNLIENTNFSDCNESLKKNQLSMYYKMYVDAFDMIYHSSILKSYHYIRLFLIPQIYENEKGFYLKKIINKEDAESITEIYYSMIGIMVYLLSSNIDENINLIPYIEEIYIPQNSYLVIAERRKQEILECLKLLVLSLSLNINVVETIIMETFNTIKENDNVSSEKLVKKIMGKVGNI